MKGLLRYLLICLALMLSVTGCSKPQVARCTGPEDNPLHHYLRGMEALENGQTEAAKDKFDRAMYCDDEFSLAHSGLAIVAAERAKEQKDAGFKGVETERAMQELEKAKK